MNLIRAILLMAVLLLGVCGVGAKPVTPDVPSTAQKLKLFYQTNNAGLYSQFLQVKIMLYIARKVNRQLVVSPVVSDHYNDEPLDVCSFFALPVDVTCAPIPQALNCTHRFPSDLLNSKEPELCYGGTVRFNIIEAPRQFVIEALDVDNKEQNFFPLAFNATNLKYVKPFKKALGMVDNKTPYTVVHWRRGDQLASRCRLGQDKSINCYDAKKLISVIREYTSDEIVFVATNEPENSSQLAYLNANGFKTFREVEKLLRLPHPLDLFSVLAIESTLMLDASTFLGWGISEVNDVVENERFKSNQQHCVNQTHVKVMDELTWCALHDRKTLLAKSVVFQKPFVQAVERLIRKEWKHEAEGMVNGTRLA